MNVLLLSALLLGARLADDSKANSVSTQPDSGNALEKIPSRVATKADLRQSYNQLMAFENSPSEKAKMDRMMEKLAGIKVGSTDSLATTEDVTSESSKPEIKTQKEEKDDRKLVGNDPIAQMNSEMGQDDAPLPADLQGSGPMPPMDENMPPMDENLPPMDSGAGHGRKLNFGNMMDSNLGSDSNMEMANMKSSFDNLHSVAPGTGDLDLDSGSDSLNDIGGGMHQDATNAMINRMDQTNQQRMEQLNSMFPPPSKLMPGAHKKKKSHVISIKKMLKNYPPGLVDEFMPELKEKVMHKFNQMRSNDRMTRRIRRLRRKLQKQKQRERRRRKLRQRRKRRELRRRRQRRHHHHHHRHHNMWPKHKFKPHFSLKRNLHHQFHSLGVVNRFMHRRRNQLHHLHHLKERRLEESPNSEDTSQISMVLSNETGNENQFLELEKELEAGNISKINQSEDSKGKAQ